MTTQTPSTPASDADVHLRKSKALATAKFENSADCVKIRHAEGRLTDLVKLKVDIEAIDFALAHRPTGVPAESQE